MFLAFHHSAHTAIHVLVSRAVFLEAAASFVLGLLPLFLCFVEQKEGFHLRKYSAVESLPPFSVVAKR